MKWLTSLLLIALAGIASALSAAGARTLVVLEDQADKDKYSQFWSDLTGRGFSLTFKSPKDDSLSLFRLGERAYDHVVLLPTKSKGLGPNLAPQLLVDFVNKDGNILLALSGESTIPSQVVSVLLEFDIHLPTDRNALTVDHFNYDKASAAEKHDVLVIDRAQRQKAGIKNFFSGEGVLAVPHAVGHTLGNDSPLLVPILRAPSTAYVYNPKEESEAVEDPFAVGQQLSLVSAFQGRNSARLTVLGSAEMLQDAWFDAKVERNSVKGKTANREFAKQLTAWTFKEVGVLKVGRLQHFLNEGAAPAGINGSDLNVVEHNPKIYRIKNDVTFQIEVSEYVEDHLEPFVPPAGDAVQLEFTMLSPFHRLELKALPPSPTHPNSTIFTTDFRLPDQHGIFNFRVNYKRPFLTNLDEKREVTVRHFAHDEWPRSYLISGAWTWIAGIWVTVAGWLGFVALWLYSAPRQAGGVKKKQ
ncbi:Dolichyl-diphosphooligosaccharide-protein glycosyltransferase [Lasiodiplodia theobromae]|uniref:Dolichyl-diphosphooligosaccharide-protein glycosyltransferase n=1 Tax=Lasiodiplodia theobromae TaxID=45133 RepID=UPI0015C3B459|nr:Dolichyl-diphosphooligosaccharide-protein glycosyltransferase [Lasiodiplodia theobromae]KAF4542654.1 Dolichyl-diphosphooligosaccharide-protein glycosyltransferase [Lasiodiplodia theobromae]